MQSRWNEAEAAACSDDLALRVYSSRLLGSDKALVLHGGGNTSVKLAAPDIFGDMHDLLFVKGSGWDLATIKPAGFAPVRMDHLLRLAQLESLSDLQMAAELRRATVEPAAPAPSVEAILHAILPFRFVDHTHADALISLTNTPNGLEHVRAAYGEQVVVIPYIMPGFALAKLCAELYPVQAGAQTVGMVLMNHGLFTWGATAREAYERHIALVTVAEEYLARQGAWQISMPERPPATPAPAIELARLRNGVSELAGAPMILRSTATPAMQAFAQRSDIATLTQQGPATPDHIIRTKRLPQLGRDLAGYAAAYRQYFAEQCQQRPLTMLDPAPRVILDREFGLVVAGRTLKDALIAKDIYTQTIPIILRAAALGGWQALSAQDLFEVEYWDLEQAKLKQAGTPAALAGQVALVTGAASGIGRACVEVLRGRGACVVAIDIDQRLPELFNAPEILPVVADVTDSTRLAAMLEQAVYAYGGLDMVVVNAGVFGASTPIASLADQEWERILRINLDANLALLRMVHPFLQQAPAGGRVVVIGSKNVPAPGPGAAAYSASKAALTQLARVAALEWGRDGIRVNVLHPNAVFDTGLWTEEVLASRAASYGMSVEQYKTNNLLRVEITSRDVAELAAELCGPRFAKTTGAQIPIDGGNERVI